MKSMRIIIAAIMFAVAFVNANYSYASTKRALLIGISDYGNPRLNAGQWRDIHGANDVRLLYPVLKEQGFKIDTLTDDYASKYVHPVTLSNVHHKNLRNVHS